MRHEGGDGEGGGSRGQQGPIAGRRVEERDLGGGGGVGGGDHVIRGQSSCSVLLWHCGTYGKTCRTHDKFC